MGWLYKIHWSITMNNDIASLDFHNSHFYIRLDGCEYYSDSSIKFLEDIEYPHDINVLSYEPSRGIYNLEDKSGTFHSDAELPELKWFADNRAHLLFVISNIEQSNTPVVTLAIERNMRFADTDWLVQRHQEEILLMKTPTLTNTQFAALLHYRQQLRNLTQNYPATAETNAVTWPTNPIN